MRRVDHAGDLGRRRAIEGVHSQQARQTSIWIWIRIGIHVGDVDKDGRRTVTFELNGMTREASIVDRSVQAKAKTRPKADLADPLQVGAPIPGLITSLAVSVGTKVSKGDKLLTLEAMKMQSTLYASGDGTVDAILAQVGDTVESKDLLMKLRK